jgi:ubiquinone/menaquinone biosynthesis C-methylase UbiE
MEKSTQDKISEKYFYDTLFLQRHRFDQFQDEIYDNVSYELRRRTAATRALDLGCGSGTQTLSLMKHGFSVIAVDLSFEATKLFKRNMESAGLTSLSINADAEHLPFPDASIDACVCGLLLHHFKHLDTVAAELKRIISYSGVVITLDANAHNPFIWFLFNVVHRRIRKVKNLTPNQRALWRRDISKVFSTHGFGEFQFSSITSELRRDWLGDSIGAKLIYHIRKSVLRMSRLFLPEISHGNMLLSVLRKVRNN